MSREHFNKSTLALFILVLVFVVSTSSTKAARGLPNNIHLQHDCKALNTALRIFLDEIERHLRAHSPGRERIGAPARWPSFTVSAPRSTCTPTSMFCVIDGVFEPDASHGVRFTRV